MDAAQTHENQRRWVWDVHAQFQMRFLRRHQERQMHHQKQPKRKQQIKNSGQQNRRNHIRLVWLGPRTKKCVQAKARHQNQSNPVRCVWMWLSIPKPTSQKAKLFFEHSVPLYPQSVLVGLPATEIAAHHFAQGPNLVRRQTQLFKLSEKEMTSFLKKTEDNSLTTRGVQLLQFQRIS